MQALEVGKYIEGVPRNYPEGPLFEILDDIMILAIYMSRPTPSEMKAFSDDIKLGYAKVDDNLFFLVKIGEIPWMDAPYNVLLEKTRPDLSRPEKGQGYGLLIVLVDAADGMVKHIRLVTMTNDFSNKFMDEVESQKPIENYDMKLDRIYRRFPSTEHLFRYATFQ